jgi:4-hydroxymandelate oxidase
MLLEPRPINLLDYEQLARDKLSKMAYDYYAGGADNAVTLRENNAAFDRLRLYPRVLVDVSQRSTTTTLLGQTIPAPIVIAPMALAGMAHADAELATARGAAGIPLTVSTVSSRSIEEIAAAAQTPLWFQLYIYRDRAITQSLVQRAESSGYRTLVVTVDVPLAGNRERDRRNQFRLPPDVTARNFENVDLHNFSGSPGESSIAAYVNSQFDPSLTWADLDWLASMTNLSVIVKGILRADDARRACDHGAKGIVISNHGGRQLDTVPATIDLLPHIAAEVNTELLIDGGIRRGTDIIKALALGAKAVMVGRPIMWGLAVGGADGVRHVLEILRTEFDHALALCGCASVTDVTPDLMWKGIP